MQSFRRVLATGSRMRTVPAFTPHFRSLSSIKVRPCHMSCKRPSRDPLVAHTTCPPGAVGPASPDAPEDDTFAAEADALQAVAREAKAKLAAKGYDAASFWEQPIVWGDHDAFQHVNNVRYVRFFESGRMKWITAVGNSIGAERANMMLSAKGISFILKSIDVKFRRPVRYPDTVRISSPHHATLLIRFRLQLLIAHKASPWPHTAAEAQAPINPANPPLYRTQFLLHAKAWSYAQNAVVADSTSVITWYDYDNLKKCDPGDELWAAVLERTQRGE
ncbi:hypothetical protein EVG20_g4763 [Dentipellis fragilis]|uniref:Thioesterase domain-containing protein n=1 Tax=Dentipellis fragilis TaxID=205917 RepID=A0A4Y9YVK2_9AGAM|nr:hypothetical protein EVG20_g4763 [Dentipellis fragilis]